MKKSYPIIEYYHYYTILSFILEYDYFYKKYVAIMYVVMHLICDDDFSGRIIQ